ncbi:sulfotransferase domain-containing protein [Celeribacter halophilus]|uniref:Sulfotransferase domain-containing protein n=1 Tax=Celeribacter halophilus TaxID=576117 RepID=A0AAW7XWG8_9RHOB|nr:sulfotransferase domain-containing protein [Celeribacter halophilus]MDO6458412.1 sulfotransferase domain-containing protein [Celeribacter halophilus]
MKNLASRLKKMRMNAPKYNLRHNALEKKHPDLPVAEKDKTFLLCLGTQKAGTSWLFDFIQGIDTVQMGYVKELHVFDRLEFEGILNADLNRVKAIASSEDIFRQKHLWKRLSLISDPEQYYTYFDHILQTDKVTLTGDFTPEYCMLPHERLLQIKNKFQERGIKVKIIFLMRDPVERISSARRMTARVLGIERPLLEVYKGQYVEMLTRYEKIIPKIRAVFGKDEIYINFYENLFEKQTIDEILGFLQLPRTSPDFSKRINASRYQEIRDNERHIIAEYYSDTYEFVRREFGQIYPQNAWH